MIMIHGQKGTTPEVERTKGCNKAIGENAGVKLVAEQWSEQWSQAEGLNIGQNLLQAHPDTTLIFAQADGLALGAAQAVKVSGASQRIYVGGFDGDTTACRSWHRRASMPRPRSRFAASAVWPSTARSSSLPAKSSRPNSFCRAS